MGSSLTRRRSGHTGDLPAPPVRRRARRDWPLAHLRLPELRDPRHPPRRRARPTRSADRRPLLPRRHGVRRPSREAPPAVRPDRDDGQHRRLTRPADGTPVDRRGAERAGGGPARPGTLPRRSVPARAGAWRVGRCVRRRPGGEPCTWPPSSCGLPADSSGRSASLLVVVPGVGETLQVVGDASIATAVAVLAQVPPGGSPTEPRRRHGVVTVRLHCGKRCGAPSRGRPPPTWPRPPARCGATCACLSPPRTCRRSSTGPPQRRPGRREDRRRSDEPAGTSR